MVGSDGVPVKASAISLMTSPMIMKELESSSCHIVYLYIGSALFFPSTVYIVAQSEG